MWWNEVVEFFSEGSIGNYILDGYLLFIVVFFVLWFALRNKHFYAVLLPTILVILFGFLAEKLNLGISKEIYSYILMALPIIFIMNLEKFALLAASTKKYSKNPRQKASIHSHNLPP